MYENGKILEIKEPYLLQNTDKEAPYDISFVVPAYNEFNRLPKMMNETIEVRLFLI
jgi:hypothetical protein